MTRRAARRPAVILPATLSIAGALAGGVAALMLGFAPEWDTLNYHLYNPHALLHGRWGIDLAPAQMQTFLNPVFHLPHYLLFRYASPEVLVFVLGAAQGAQLPLLWLLAVRLLAPRAVATGWLVPVALLGVGGPVFLAELGGTQGDSVLSALVLGGLLLLLPEAPGRRGQRPGRRAVLAGLLLGCATALKLVFGVYAAALGLAALLCLPGSARWKDAFLYGCGGLAGLLLAGGPWFAWMAAEYQNPLFPYFNNLFGSDWMVQASLRDLRFMPRSVAEWLAYPAVWLQDPRRVWEWPFRDLRPLLLLPGAAVALLVAWRRLPVNLRFVCVFVIAAYVLWLCMFSIYRYLAVLEMLAPPVLFALVVQWRASRGVVAATLAVLLASQAAVRFVRHEPLWELRAGQPSALSGLPADAMVIIDGYAPVGFTALWLDDRIPLVRVRANFMSGAAPATRMHRLAEQRVRQHRGPVYLLLSPEDLRHPYLASDLERLGLHWPGVDACAPLFEDARLTARLGLRLCPLTRHSGLFQIAGR